MNFSMKGIDVAIIYSLPSSQVDKIAKALVDKGFRIFCLANFSYTLKSAAIDHSTINVEDIPDQILNSAKSVFISIRRDGDEFDHDKLTLIRRA